jgi:dynein heavy chain 1
VRIIFEVADLKYATMATVSRCVMVRFSEDVVTPDMLFCRYLQQLQNVPLNNENGARVLDIQKICADVLSMNMQADGLISLSLNYSNEELDHIMEPSKQRHLMSFFSMLNYSIKQLISYELDRPDFPLTVCFIFCSFKTNFLTSE